MLQLPHSKCLCSNTQWDVLVEYAEVPFCFDLFLAEKLSLTNLLTIFIMLEKL